jgi:uncharacterized cupin superfamily protein
MATTLIRRRDEMPTKIIENCHDGQGPLPWVGVLAREDLPGRQLKFVQDDILPPGSSIGEHQHCDDEEYYLILSGTGTMRLDGQEHRVGPGDITAVFPGGTHALANDGDEDMRLIVFCLEVGDTPNA